MAENDTTVSLNHRSEIIMAHMKKHDVTTTPLNDPPIRTSNITREKAKSLLSRKRLSKFDPKAVDRLLEVGKTLPYLPVTRSQKRHEAKLPNSASVIIAHYGQLYVLLVNGEILLTAGKYRDAANLQALRKQAKKFAEGMCTDLVHADVPEILSSYSPEGLLSLLTKMGYFTPEGSLFQRAVSATVVLIDHRVSTPRLNTQWVSLVTRAAKKNATATTPIYNLRAATTAHGISFDQLCNAKCIDKAGFVWAIPMPSGASLRIELF